ncbi:MAG: peptide ABC transporter ATP-binding protein [Rickettsiales bacterium]|nr:peptide ABC transporter ATP-binding protein [Rickettsiales bacterium]
MVINIKHVSKSIQLKDKRLEILRDISFDLESNNITLLYGKSGSGKTTLLHILSGLDQPTHGECIINGVTISDLSVDQRAEFRLQNIGMVYQFFNLIPNLTIFENIKLPLILDRKKIDVSYINQTAAYLGITEILNQYPPECSGGELQRASFARAMINKPKLIIADEPTGNLDSENRQMLLELIKNLSIDYGITFFIATHDDQFKDISNNIINIVDGEVHS